VCAKFEKVLDFVQTMPELRSLVKEELKMSSAPSYGFEQSIPQGVCVLFCKQAPDPFYHHGNVDMFLVQDP
jgi:hypothetical protein